jgi:tRNA G10  N-methylase Trm11
VNAYDYTILRSDLNADSADIRADFTNLPYPDDSLDALVIDPPYLYTGGWKTMRNYFHDDNERWSGSTYGNKERAQTIRGVQAVDQMYFRGIAEARRCLKHKGIVIIKCMDQVMSGKQVWAHITYNQFAESIGFRSEDIFVTVRKTQPLMRHKPEAQKHARKNHSFFLVLRNWKK